MQSASEQRRTSWRGAGLLPMAGTVAAIGYLLLTQRAARGAEPVDLATRELVHRRLPRAAKPIGTGGSAIGHPVTYHAASWLAYRWLKRRRVEGAELVPAAALATWAAYRLTKLIVDRERPEGDHGKMEEASYPSGHTAGTTAVALTTGLVLARSGMAPTARLLPLMIGVPLVVGASRVLMDEHWSSDVVGGWLLGTVVASGMVRTASG